MGKFVNDLEADFVRSLFSYCETEGKLRWKTRPDVPRSWNAKHAGKIAGASNAGYRKIKIGFRFYFEHRLIWLMVHGQWPVEEIDHVNGIKSDNRICNLRPATNAENVRNVSLRKNNTSGYKGVRKTHGAFTWSAEITFRRIKYNLGSFPTKEAAHAAYCEAARNNHAEFANTGEARE